MLCVAGYILRLLLAELSIQPLNNSVIILKQNDVIVTDDAWRIAVDNDVNVFEDALSTIKTDSHLIGSQKQEFTPISESDRLRCY